MNMYIRNPSVNRNLSRLMWKWYLYANSDGSGKPACASTQSRQSLRCSLIQYMEQRARDLVPLNGCTCALEGSQNAINYEPPRDKTNKMTLRPAKTQISLGIRPVWSESSLSAEESLGPKLPLSAQRRLIRLGGCPGWPESSLGAQPQCWFCHDAALICDSHHPE